MKLKRISWFLSILIGFFIFLLSCSSGQNIETGAVLIFTITPTPTSTYVPTLTETVTSRPTTTVSIKYVPLDSVFIPECGDTLIIVDNSLNGIQSDFTINNLTGHCDFWPSSCNVQSVDGEVIAPVTGKIDQTQYAIQLCLPPNTYLEGTDNALLWMGKNLKATDIDRTCLEFGHLNLLPELNVGDTVEKGQSLGDVDVGYGGIFYKLSYHVFLFYNGQALMTSPTIYRHETPYIEPNFTLPSTSDYELIFPNGLVPFQYDSRVITIMGDDWEPFFCYPESNAQH